MVDFPASELLVSGRVMITLPKFNSEFTPEKLPRAPIGKDRLPFPSFFRGELLNFGRVIIGWVNMSIFFDMFCSFWV